MSWVRPEEPSHFSRLRRPELADDRVLDQVNGVPLIRALGRRRSAKRVSRTLGKAGPS